jgi:hypothetical protein
MSQRHSGVRSVRRLRGVSGQALALALGACLLALPALGGGASDLVVNQVDASGVVTHPQLLTISGSVSATVANIGSAGTGGGFTVRFFEDRNFNKVFDPGVDGVLASTASGPLASGATTTVNAAVGGTLLFRDNLVFAQVDALGQVSESNETNNINHSGATCALDPPAPLSFKPELKWRWPAPGASIVEPDSLNVMMTPAVIDLNNDGIPDVIFGSTKSTSGDGLQPGILRAISGKDGSALFNVTNPAFLINCSTSVAVGDIDGDGKPEIVAAAALGTRLFAFEHDGTPKNWPNTTIEQIGVGAISIANLDGQGNPEIIVGRQVLNSAGVLLWTGNGGQGTNSSLFPGPISIVADIDLDGRPEVIAGNTVYRGQTVAGQWTAGSKLWKHPTLGDGLNAVANFDADPYPEIVLVSEGCVSLLEHTGTVKWGPIKLPGDPADGGAPTVADFDGDGLPEIGVAGRTRYAVYNHDGSLLWASVIDDTSSSVTGSSVFDFNGDGSAEVVYRDQQRLHIFRGTDGAELADMLAISSATWQEYPLVVDVDGDGRAEVVVVANNNFGYGPQRGIYVYGGQGGSWVPTRQLWNQHAYHITNVNDDGTIPLVENNNWLFPPGKPYNNYRQNLYPGLPATAAPDLTASFISFDCDDASRVTVRIGNGGAVNAGSGVPVAFYAAAPQPGATPLGIVHTTTLLPPGQYEDVTFNLPPGTNISQPIYAVADDAGGLVSTRAECDETNNQHSASGALCGLQIFCPPDTTGNCGALDPMFLGSATASDQCDPDPTITYSDSPPVGSPPVITRTWKAVNGCGLSATCVQKITVVGATQPSITCPPPATIECGSSAAPSVTGTATGSDPSGSPVTITFTDTTAPGTCPVVAVITRQWTATNPCGGTASCTQTITVRDTTGPAITCPPDITLACGEAVDPAVSGSATASGGGCDMGVTVSYSDAVAPGTMPGDAIITRTWTATDACGNSRTCTQRIISLADTEPPSISTPGELTVEAVSPLGIPVGDVTIAVTATDNCSVTVTDDRPPDRYPPGTTIVTFTARDPSGNTAQSTTQVTVRVIDTGAPIINCQATVEFATCATDEGIAAVPGSSVAISVSATDAVGNVTVTDNRPAFFPLGATVVTFTARDDAGNTATCQTVVTVFVTTDPDVCPPQTAPSTFHEEIVVRTHRRLCGGFGLFPVFACVLGLLGLKCGAHVRRR